MISTQLATAEKSAWFVPKDLIQAIKLSEQIASSDLAPKDYRGKPANVLIAMQLGFEIGLAPMQSVQGIAIINGRPLVWGDALLGLVMSHHEYYGKEEESSSTGAKCTLSRKTKDGRIETVVSEFTLKDAEIAGLLSKGGVWKQYPKRMLLWRARTFAIRDLFADVIKGLSTVEEFQHEIDITPGAANNPLPTTMAQKIKNKIGVVVETLATKLENEETLINDLEPNVDQETGEILDIANDPNSPIPKNIRDKAKIIEALIVKNGMEEWRERWLNSRNMSSFEEFTLVSLDWCEEQIDKHVKKQLEIK